MRRDADRGDLLNRRSRTTKPEPDHKIYAYLLRGPEVYLRAYATVAKARNSIGAYLEFYNGRRPHSSLDESTPDQAYFNSLPLRLAA